MSFAKKSTDKEDVKQGGSNYILGSGIYPVTILAPFVDTGDKGSEVVNFFVSHQGQEQTIYGNLRVTNNNDAQGEPVVNQIGMRVFNQILVIADLDDVEDAEEAELPIGPGGKAKVVDVLQDMCDIDIMMRVQLEYTNYNNKIKETKVVKGFYRMDDNATAEEIVNDSEVGKGFEADQKYVNNITYKDDLTEADITAWVANGRKGGTGGSATKPAADPAFKKKKRFVKK